MRIRRGASAFVAALALVAACAPDSDAPPADADAHALPAHLVGEFEDDYGIRYEITPDQWLQRPGIVYEIVASDTAAMTLLARNGADNPSEAGLWTRIDWMELGGMPPWEWAYCLTVYDAATREAAEAAASADRTSPRDGCNGFPFSRMRRVDSDLEELGKGYASAWSGQDADAFASYYAADGTLIVNGSSSVGRDAIRATAAGFMAAFPDMRVTMDSIVGGETEDLATFHWHWTGTNTGEGGTGRAVDLHGYEDWTLDGDGLIRISDGHYDEAEYARQMSADGE